ncbi:MAG TPA: class I SAM-dependent methyltransferase [Casimicrobiaceae bacterium]|jgi:ubiquinone/menaquinone biosynthesis C-methylase UbiE
MSDPLEFTGERFVPGTEGEIAYEHWHRYFFARRFVAGRRVLDVACGEGYGSALLTDAAADVIGIDIDAATIAHAGSKYADRRNLRFVQGSVTALPVPSASIDAIVSFETIEHVDADLQRQMISEFARVLAPEGLLVLSSPNRPEYSDARNYANPFHRHELDRDDLARLLDPAFPEQRWYRQRRYFGSSLWAEQHGEAFESWCSDQNGATSADAPPALYFVVIAARDNAALPPPEPALSLFCDRDDREWRRIEAQEREVLRLDALLHDRDAALDRQTAHIHHLENLVAERDAALAAANVALSEVNAQLTRESEQVRSVRAALQTECGRLERAIAAQERIINYRQSARWWVMLPWLRVKLLWKRLSGI